MSRVSQRWQAGVELAAALNAEFLGGRATRPACEVERRLAACRQCDQFRGNDCAELELQPDGPGYVALLVRQDLHCRRWSVAEESVVRATCSDAELARMHDRGPVRSQAERRAARREGRRRKAVGSR